MAQTNKHELGGKSRLVWAPDSEVKASFSPCEQYRYSLTEIWDKSKPLILWLLMNPSVASEEFCDPTLLKTGKYSRLWGFGGQMIGNVHAYRVTDKNRLLEVEDPVGPGNDQTIAKMAQRADKIVLGYGIPPKQLARRGVELVNRLQKEYELSYLKLNRDGSPSHPLYLSLGLELKKFSGVSQ